MPKVSEKSWSSFSASDYSPEQWHAACLIHQHEGAPTSKNQCKLPVREPDGTLNKAGVQAAAAALAGARGGVAASSSEKDTAGKALLRFYKQLDMEPPASLTHSSVGNFLAHALGVSTPSERKNTEAVVVALPKDLDSIRLVGDEDKHATLLYFGETSSLPADAKSNLISLITKASRMFTPFSESVIDVARLGSETPPALVSMLSNRCLGRIRGAMLMDSVVGDYLQNASQHPQFTPHVTLGYPDYQGEQAIRELAKQVFRVKFDRLALWWNDERIEFELNQYPADEEEARMAMHSDIVSSFLASQGVVKHAAASVISDDRNVEGGRSGRKGGRSGAGGKFDESKVKRDGQGQFAKKESRNKGPKEDENWAKNLFEVQMEVTRQAKPKIDSALQRLAEEKGTDVEALAISDTAEFNEAIVKVMNEQTSTRGTVSPSGEQRVEFYADSDNVIKARAVSNRRPNVRHTTVIEDFFAHYGIKGMRWGIRRQDGPDGTVSGKGGRHDNADTDGDGKKDTRLSADAERVMGTLSKESHEMSTREMKEAIERGRQIKQYKEMFGSSELDRKVQELRTLKEYKQLKEELTPEKVSAAKKFARGAAAGFAAYQQVDSVLGGQLSKGLSKKVGTALGQKEPGPSALDLLKEKNQTLSLTKQNMEIEKSISAMTPKPPTAITKTTPAAWKSPVAASYIKSAKDSVQDAKDLNSILDSYLSQSKPGTVAPTGPNPPKPGTPDYGLSLITRRR